MKNCKINFKNTNLLLIFILPIIFLLFGLKKQSEIHEKLMVQGIGIDFAKNKYKVTVQAYDFKNPENKDEPKIKIIESENETVSAALQNLKKITGLFPIYSQNKIIIIGEEAAKRGVRNIIDFFVRFYENRPSVKMRISKGNAGEIFKTKVDGKELKSSEIKDLVDEKFDINVLEFEKNLESKTSSAVLFLIEKKEDEQIICEKIVLFKGDKPFKFFSDEETLGAKILRNCQNIGVCNIKTSENDFISLKINNIKTKIVPKFENEKLQFEIKLELSCDLIESTKKFRNTEDMILESEKFLNEKIEKTCEKAIESSVFEGCDIFKFGKILQNKYPSLFGSEKINNYLIDATYKIDVDSKISMIGIEKR